MLTRTEAVQGMRSILPAAVLLGALAAALAACGELEPPGGPTVPADPNDGPPEARLTIVFDDVVVEGYAYTAFACNPLETRDDRTARHVLTARWDWEHDGTWDTVFRPLDYESGFVPSPLPTGTWTAKCEVRDEAGHIVGVADTVSLPDPWYRAPDLVARRATVDTLFGYSETDTVRVGQFFLVMANHLRWTERGTGGRMHVEVYLDGALVQRTEHGLGPNLHWGSDEDANRQYRDCRLSVPEPGLHTITVVVDADGVLAETDETNNSRARTFVAVP